MEELKLPLRMAELRPELAGFVSDIDSQGAYGAILLSSKSGLRIEVDNHVERIVQPPPTAGTVITAFDGDTIHECALAGFDRTATWEGVKDTIDEIAISDPVLIELGPTHKADYITPTQIAPESLTTEEKMDRCRQLHRRVKRLGKNVVNVRLRYNEATEVSLFRNRDVDLGQCVKRIAMHLVVITGGSDGSRRYDFARKSGMGGWEHLDFSDDEIEALVYNAQALLNADRIKPGEYDVITSPTVSGIIAHESFGHGVETDMFLKDRAKAVQYVDRVVASPLVNIFDDPSLPGEFGSYFFDDEGWLSSPTQIVEDGVFRRGITDLYSATSLGLPRSANGRRQDFGRKAYARMSNTFFARGETQLTDLFAQVDDGVYLEKASSGMEDPLGWGIQVTCLYGREIKNGEVTQRLFAPVGISGYVPEVLQSISAVGDLWELEGGACEKTYVGKERVYVSDGGPHLLLKVRLA